MPTNPPSHLPESKDHLEKALAIIKDWHNSLFKLDLDGETYLTDKKLERQLRRIKDMLEAML